MAGLTASSGFVVLDTKYRARKGGIVDGMAESAHPYQDALRWHGKRPDATVLLVPDAAQAEFLSEAAFFADNQVGAVTFRPGAALPHWFRDVLLGGILPGPDQADSGSEPPPA